MALGRPTLYKTEYDEQVKKLCLLGATDKELADFFEVCEDTINEWKLKYDNFSVSIKAGKIQADADVAASLYKRAVGFEYNEVTFEKLDNKINLEVTPDGDITTDETYKKKIVTKLIAPDVAAINIWLKNRRGKVDKDAQRWADKIETGTTDTEGNDVKPFADEQVDKIISAIRDTKTT